MQLRDYQIEDEQSIAEALNRVNHVLYVLFMGGGKTVMFSKIVRDHQGHSLIAVHRRELVFQISLTLASFGVHHNVIAPKDAVRSIVQAHVLEFGRNYFDPNAPRNVGGVKTILSRATELKPLLERVTLFIPDEAHHVLRENEYGVVAKLLSNSKTLGVTANTKRGDGKGLGAHAHGIFEEIVEGPGGRHLINQGYLIDYRIFAPPSDLDLDGVKISVTTGDYNPNQLKTRVRKSHIVGDVITHYIKLAPGKIGITFATDVETAGDIAARYNAAGVPAEVVCSKTPSKVRTEINRRLRRGDLKQVVNVDIYGEGVDVPAIEVISMARPTESFNLFCQQFGRPIRPIYADGHDLSTITGRLSAITASGSSTAIIIDHVGNVIRHGLPDAPQKWTLDARERGTRGKRDPDIIPVRACTECTAVYERIYKVCPFCGHIALPTLRSAPEFVDGDLTELDAEALAAMRGETARVDASAASVLQGLERSGLPYPAAKGAANRHTERQEAQATLRDAIALWAGHQRAVGRPDTESYRLFYFNFGVDVMTAQTLGRPDALDLAARINKRIGR